MKMICKIECEIAPVMIGTAGHVDHGKTALVRLLTGCETDILPEEKKRGMSIDLGFAPFLLDDNRMAGIIDVPGHEDFIRNMIAGAVSIDVLILIIAADDGIMPQTIEHMKIMSLLRTPSVMAVITKIDMVSKERQAEVQKEVKKFLKSHGFDNAPVIPESNITGDGIGEVRSALNLLVQNIKRTEENRPFRMNIEKIFSVKGFGTVVTGIPLSGSCQVGTELELFPGGVSVVCRSIQKYSMASKEATAHSCTAINIKAEKLPEIKRGMTLAAAKTYRESCSAVLSIKNVHETMPLKRREELRFCCGTKNSIASGVILGARDAILPGEKGFVQVKFSEPLLLSAGDRFVLRSLSPSATVAGGTVLSINPGHYKKKARFDTEKLEKARIAVENNKYFESEILAGGSAVLKQNELAWLFQKNNNGLSSALDEKIRSGLLIPAGTRDFVVAERVLELEERLKYALTSYHKKNKLSKGMPLLQVCALLGLSNEAAKDLGKVFAGSNLVAVNGESISLKGFSIELSSKQAQLKERVLSRIKAAGKSVLAVKTLEDELGPDGPALKTVVGVLTGEGILREINRYLFPSIFIKEAFEKLTLSSKNGGPVELGRFRELTGFSRNVAVSVLEYFDSKGITRREGNERKLLKTVFSVC